MTETGVVTYQITDAAIAKMESQYMILEITDLYDKEQFDTVHGARMTIKSHRVAVEKKRKELKADALAWGKKVDSEAKRIFGKLEPIEDHLMAEENKVFEAEKRRKEEEDRKEREKIQKRVDSLFEYGAVMYFVDVAMMGDKEFDDNLEHARVAYVAEQARIAAEQKAREEENKRLAEERAELERLQKEQAEAQTKIDAATRLIEADRKALEDEKRKEQERKDREAFEKQAAEEARIKAEKDAKEKAEREARENLERAAREIAEEKRKAALKPDKEKLVDWINRIQSVFEPEIKDELARGYLSKAVDKINEAIEVLSVKIERL